MPRAPGPRARPLRCCARPERVTAFFRGHWQLLALTALVFALWTTPVVLPLKILVVVLHELAHGAAAVLTGGELVEIDITQAQGGHAITRGGSRFAILTAGYLGSLLLGVALFLAALRTRADKVVATCFGLLLLSVTALYIRTPFAIFFCAGAGAGLLAMARYLSHDVNDMVLRIIGLSSMIYVPYDIFDDTIARAGTAMSDAAMLAQEFGGPTVMWGGLWLILSLAVIAACLRAGLRRPSNLSFGRG
ncbi:M50 family peptidase [Roseovarius faecimaris]|uniref:M50 family peptidase n=1 Tax=Roseovarius faecimaris TaxID=2494550 RepID=A0A6I6IUH6_9RHOB|nr:M50 family peptidase [Roseovarius faecimaris]